MKKALPIIALLLVAAGAWYFTTQGGTSSPSRTPSAAKSGSEMASTTQGSSETQRGVDGASSLAGANPLGADEFNEDDEALEDLDLKPATETYTNAEDALKAVKAGAVNYDDIILEQFMLLGPECTWCNEFYGNVRELVFSAQTKPEERSYYAELLAISGRVENVSAILDAAKNAANQEDKDIYLESLELTAGGDDILRYLGENMQSDDPNIKEAVVAAVTNQGSRMAAEMLYNQVVSSGDPDGYYSVGIGLGELVPDDSAVPYLQDIVVKRDAYSHLAVKALLNNGVNGVRVVFDVLTNSKDPDFDRKMLKDAIDHVVYDQEIEDFVKKVSESSKQPVVSEFAKQILEEFRSDDIDDFGADDEIEIED